MPSKGFLLLCFVLCLGIAEVLAVKIEPVEGRQGMVVAGHPEAAAIGLEVLRAGGNAMDAVVATSMALSVAEPYGSGIGGKGAILYFEAATGQIWYVDGMDAAGAELDVDKLCQADKVSREQGALGVGIPGLVAALDLAHHRWGRRDWPSLVLPAAELAERGSTIVPGMRILLEPRLELIQSHPETARIFLPGGQLPEEGARLANPDLGGTLRLIASQRGAGFYEGITAENIVRELRDAGSDLTLEDFRAYRARLGTPLHLEYNGNKIFAGGPPSTGGATALLSLKVLEGYEWPDPACLRTTGNLDAWGRVLRHVYPQIQATMADIGSALIRYEELLSPQCIGELREAAFGANPTIPEATKNDLLEVSSGGDAWTTHFVVVDSEGNVASVTQSLSHHFGSGIVAPGTGVVLNNSLVNFSFLDSGEVNYPAPGKRPRSTIAPTLVLRNNRPVLAIGLPGGGRIPTTLLTVLLDYYVFASPLGAAIGAPRFHLRRDLSGQPISNTFQVEKGFPAAEVDQLRTLGWTVTEVTDAEHFGGVTAVEINENGLLKGWADFRRTNQAAGY
ncbi:MAG TPA: gamma-glutamyltransferase family protein [Oceanipulchritudo sp.]|nr:gamma-glutamyltransferase family protein [Oceanipulchritudo sp.]